MQVTIENHLNYRGIKYDKARVGFVCGGLKKQKLKGITDGMSKCFWPDYELQVAAITPQERVESEYTFGREINATGPSGGQKRGTVIHRELKRHADMMRASPEEYERYKESCKKVPPAEWTLMCLKALESKGLHLLFSELCVGDEENGLATAIDLVCVDEEHKHLYLVETKTGYANVFTKGCGSLHHMEASISDCPLNQSKLQLAISSVLFEKTFDGVPVSGHYILNVSRTGTDLYHVDNTEDEIILRRRAIYESFLLWRKQKKDESARRKRLSRTARKDKEEGNGGKAASKKTKKGQK